jgi:hypothetical protein
MTAIDRLGGLQSSVAIKEPCVAATTANITLDGPQTIDGVSVVAGNRVLVWNQTDNTTNGIYVCDSGVWGRDSDFNGANQVTLGTIVLVTGGAQYGSTIFEQTTANPVIGTTAITFSVAGAAALALASAFMRASFLNQTTAAAALAALGGAAPLGYTLLNPANNLSDLSNVATARSNLGISATAVLRSYLAGLGMSNDGVAPNTKINVAAGTCTDDTNAVAFAPAAGSIDCTTVGANGLDTGALAINTWYHAFAIAKAAGASPAFLASTNPNAPTLPATYTLKRRIGSFRTDGSAHIIGFTQKGDDFLWKSGVTEFSGTAVGTAAQLFALTVPPGVQVEVNFTGSATGGNVSVSFSSLDENAWNFAGGNQGPGSDIVVVSGTSGNAGGGRFRIRTDTNRQIRAVASVNSISVSIFTHGWIDRRGRDD